MRIQLAALILLSSLELSFCMATATIANQKAGTGVHLPVGKDGEGEYTAATKGCFDVIDVTTPLVLEQIAKQPIRTSGSPAIHIADYGTADAGTSLGLLTKMVNGIRKRFDDPNKEVVIHYEDQLTNEWQVRFRQYQYDCKQSLGYYFICAFIQIDKKYSTTCYFLISFLITLLYIRTNKRAYSTTY